MSDSKQPFTDYATKAGQPFKMSTYVVPGAAILIVIVLSLCLWDQHVQHEREMDALRAKLKAATAAQVATQQEEAAFQAQVAALQGQIGDLQKDKEQAEQAVQSAKGLEDEMRNSLESKDVTISKLQGKLTVNILDRIMFDSGEADLKPDGEAVLAKVAAFLAQHPELKIHVIGHTDNVPIRGAARSRFPTNWELSTARALAAVRFLTERAGLDPHRVGAVGYGEYRPVADNSTPEGRARNRRIAITILPDELVGADAAPAGAAGAAPATSTNAPPSGPPPMPPAPIPLPAAGQ
jgi:chemotaxis protein MotB